MGRHRKPSNNGRRLAKASALTVMATAPLGLAGTAMASPLTAPDKHSSDDSDDTGSFTHPASYDSDYDGSSSHQRDSSDRDSSDRDSDEPIRWSVEHSTHAAERRAAANEARSDERRFSSSHRRSSHKSHSAESATSSFTGHSTSWDKLAHCESTNNWSANTGNGYKGGLQFDDTTWRRYGGGEYGSTANQASREEQIAVAKKVQARQGWAAWPSCSRKIGLA